MPIDREKGDEEKIEKREEDKRVKEKEIELKRIFYFYNCATVPSLICDGTITLL